jgi:hypothetical protein
MQIFDAEKCPLNDFVGAGIFYQGGIRTRELCAGRKRRSFPTVGAVSEVSMLPPTSIFRRMPGAIPLSLRRLLGALAYANDGAALSFARLKEVARAYRLPSDGLSYEDAGWVPVNRLSVITDAWASIDHLSRARKLVQRFPYGGPRPPEVSLFLDAMKPATAIRNRIQHLDEDIFGGVNCSEGNPVLGAVSWADARVSAGHVRYSISSGPQIDSGTAASIQLTDVDGAGDVVDFRLMAADQTVSLDEMMNALTNFMGAFEVTLSSAIISSLRDAAMQKGVPLEDPRPHGTADMTTATRMRRKPGGGWECDNGDMFGMVEVSPGSFDISDKPHVAT